MWPFDCTGLIQIFILHPLRWLVNFEIRPAYEEKTLPNQALLVTLLGFIGIQGNSHFKNNWVLNVNVAECYTKSIIKLMVLRD